jgi:hypothetical protein
MLQCGLRASCVPIPEDDKRNLRPVPLIFKHSSFTIEYYGLHCADITILSVFFSVTGRQSLGYVLLQRVESGLPESHQR